jgi:TfoX/Sxy family transcriptional regulator of competence genes
MPKHLIPRADEQATAFFRSILPEDPAVRVRPMSGNVAAFANGHMFAGVLGPDVFVRLRESEREALLKQPGAAIWEPRKGHRMKEYVTPPRT